MKGKTSTNFPIAKERRGAMDYEAQYDKIYRYCYFKLHNQTVAEDVTQETFLRFLESDTYKERGRELNYLYTIARNLCIDESRKRVTEELTEEITKEGPEERIIETFVEIKCFPRIWWLKITCLWLIISERQTGGMPIKWTLR
jgi:RNA polymerase sigma-70 factor (ECF subfamily)